MSKKTFVLGLVGVLGVAASATAASADQFRYAPSAQVEVHAQVQVGPPTRPLLGHRITPTTPALPAPPAVPPMANGTWAWNGQSYVWVAKTPTVNPYGERDQRRMEGERAAEAQRQEAQRIALARKLEQQRELQARRMAEMRRAEEARRIAEARREQARRQHDRHVAPDGTRVVVRYQGGFGTK